MHVPQAIARNGQTCLAGSLDVPPLVSYGSAMAIHPGRHQFGTDTGRITLRTFRDGLAASAGHDLTIDAVRWTGELVVEQDLAPSALTVTIDLGALVVRDGTGGIKPLSDRDKREIAVSARKVLGADRYPQATFTATGFEPDATGARPGSARRVRRSMLSLVSGHYRQGTGKVAVTQGVATTFSLRIGDLWHQGGQVRRVTGIVQTRRACLSSPSRRRAGQQAKPGHRAVHRAAPQEPGLTRLRQPGGRDPAGCGSPATRWTPSPSCSGWSRWACCSSPWSRWVASP